MAVDATELIPASRGRPREALASALEASLVDDWRSPETCHLGGTVWLWQAIEAAERGDLPTAADCWELAIPHLVVALEAVTYVGRFAAARAEVYGEPLTAEQVAGGRREAVAFAEARLNELATRAAEANDERLAQRLQLLPLLWRLEHEAAARVRCLGGVPDGCSPARCMVMGPMFAARYGLVEVVRHYLERFETPAQSELDKMLALITGSESDLVAARREALYCFSDLAMPFAYHLAEKHGLALDLLKAVTATATDEARDSTVPAGAAVEVRAGARELAIWIHVGLGTDELRRLQCDPDVVFDHFQAAVSEAQLNGASGPHLVSPARHVRRGIEREIGGRIAQLADSQDWERAVRLAKVQARLDPTKERVNEIVSLLKRQAVWHVDRDGIDAAIDCLQRAQMLAAADQQIHGFLISCYFKRLKRLMEGEQHLDAAQCCMDVLDDVRSLEERSGGVVPDPNLKKFAESAKSQAANVLMHTVQAMGEGADEQWLARTHAYVLEAVRGGVTQIPTAAASRLANQAIKLANEEQWALAYTSVDKAYEALPDEPQVRMLYENLTATAVGKLCETGEIDRADEIAERALRRLPQSQALKRARARISLRRIDVARLTSLDPEEIAKLITTIEARVDEAADMERQKATGGCYAAVIDPELRLERHLKNVQRLVNIGKGAAALTLLDEATYTGLDNVRAEYLRSTALRFVGRSQDALAVIDRILKESPRLLQLHLERARTLSQLGRFDEAEDLLVMCRGAEDESAADSTATLELGQNAWRAGRDDDAVAQMRLARGDGVPSLEAAWIESMALKRLGRDDEVGAVVAAALRSEELTQWQVTMLRWFAGEVSDDALAAEPRTRVDRLELHYWLGEMRRARGDRADGRALIRRCLDDTTLGGQSEFQHAQALLLSGQI